MDTDAQTLHQNILRLLKGIVRAYEEYLIAKGAAQRTRVDERFARSTGGKALE